MRREYIMSVCANFVTGALLGPALTGRGVRMKHWSPIVTELIKRNVAKRKQNVVRTSASEKWNICFKQMISTEACVYVSFWLCLLKFGDVLTLAFGQGSTGLRPTGMSKTEACLCGTV